MDNCVNSSKIVLEHLFIDFFKAAEKRYICVCRPLSLSKNGMAWNDSTYKKYVVQ